MAQTRITGGEWRGRPVATPRGMDVRPTTARVREALFNILGAEIVDARVVDLYAGAGTVGFEALSRGAAHVTFVERAREPQALIAETARRLGCAERAAVVRSDVIAWLRRRPREPARAALCFLDAPYRDDELLEALRLLGELGPPLVVCEHHRARRLPARLGELVEVRQAAYGMTHLTFWRRERPEEASTPAPAAVTSSDD